MAEFLKDSEISGKIEKLFTEAKEMLVLFSPYIKLHARLKDNLFLHKNNSKLKIIVVFGKNKDNIDRSFGKDEFDYFSQFPNIEIRYNSRLHAKYYENDSAIIFSSMNLYEYSHNNNIEFGIYVNKHATSIGGGFANDAHEYFYGVYQNSELLFQNTPQYEKSFGGLKTTYIRSEVEVDKLTERYSPKVKTFTPKFDNKRINTSVKYLSTTALSKVIKIQSKELFELLSKKQWITRENDSWKLTEKGIQIGGIVKNGQYGEYIAWREDMISKLK